MRDAAPVEILRRITRHVSPFASTRTTRILNAVVPPSIRLPGSSPCRALHSLHAEQRSMVVPGSLVRVLFNIAQINHRAGVSYPATHGAPTIVYAIVRLAEKPTSPAISPSPPFRTCSIHARRRGEVFLNLTPSRTEIRPPISVSTERGIAIRTFETDRNYLSDSTESRVRAVVKHL